MRDPLTFIENTSRCFACGDTAVRGDRGRFAPVM
jgi:hypothetical protein